LGWVVLLVLSVGALLLCLGLRWRLLDKHPICVTCGFDLKGIIAHGVKVGVLVCPECGADLKQAAAIRIGNRERRPGLVWTGAAFIALGIVLVGAAMWWRAAGQQLIWYEPFWLVRNRAQAPNSQSAMLYQKELIRRLGIRALNKEEIEEVVKLVLDRQGDVEKPWDMWAEVFDAAAGTGKVPAADIRAFENGCGQYWIDVRPRVTSGGPIPFEVRMVWRHARSSLNVRIGNPPSGPVLVHVVEATIDGKRLDAVAPSLFFQEVGGWVPWSKTASGPGSPSYLTANVAPGMHQLALKVRVVDLHHASDSPVELDLSGPDSGSGRILTTSVRLDVLPAGTSSVTVVNDPAVLAEMNMTHDSRVLLSMFNQVDAFRIHMPRSMGVRPAPDDCAFEVTAEAGGQWIPVGACTIRKGEQGVVGASSWLDTSIWPRIKPPPGGRLKLRFHPSQAIAERTAGINRIVVGQDIVIELDMREPDNIIR
jgi:hypothetical protein